MPHLGRWLNRDPLQEQGGINLYAYVNGNPFGYVDPDGRWAFHLNLFLGAGGGITIGYNPNNNKSFWEARLGYGYDLGLKHDPTDNGDESRQVQACGPNAMMGAEAQWGAGIMGLDVHGGTKSEFLDVAEGPDNDLLVPHVGGNTLELGKPSLAAGAHVGLYIHVVY